MSSLSSITVRDANPETDAVRIAELMSEYEGEPTTAENIVDTFSRFEGKGHFGRFVALDQSGRVIAYAKSTRMHSDKPGRFILTTIVDAAERRKGLGTKLMDLCESYAIERGGVELIVDVREDDAASIAFSKNRGYIQTHHFFESTLDVEAFDSKKHVEDRQFDEIEFTSPGADGNDEVSLRKLFEIIKIADNDAPGDFETDMSLDEFVAVYVNAKWFDPFGHIVAKHNGDYVGLSAVGEMSPGRFYTLNTGVRSDFRGRGLATALKAKAIDYAKSLGAKVIRTHNHSDNAPMLTINRNLGFVSELGWYFMTKRIEQ
ncbi:MAG: GNAT family N-acetyltransferase [Fimbriimonadales bacterium]|nr:GNAT family N-acetyltransferase [Fimbriimonadales bacterium]